MKTLARNLLSSTCIYTALLLFAAVGVCRADVGLVLNSSLNEGSSWVTGAGHAAIYLSRVCTDSPTRLRMCRPDENGSVLSNYDNFHENAPYEWNIVPVNVFLFGVDKPQYRSLFATRELYTALQNRYLEERLSGLCTSNQCVNDPEANWRYMVASTFVRTVYIFKVATTEQQDEAFIRWLQSRPNVNHYNGFRYNCADFAKDTLNFYLGGHVHSNRFNDFGMTSPKAIAASLTHYAQHHPELHLSIARYAQLPSDIPRSIQPRIGTQTTVTTKKFLLPLGWYQPWSLAVFGTAYLTTGHFNIEKAVRKYPEDRQLAGIRGERTPVTNGAADEVREAMRRDLPTRVNDAEHMHVIAGQHDLDAMFRKLETSPLRLDAQGRAVAEIDGDSVRLSADAWSSTPDVSPAYVLQLARVNFLLRAPEYDREPVVQLQHDEQRLNSLYRAVVAQHEDASSHITVAAGN